MANCKNMLHAEIDLSRPVPEVCSVIAHVIASWPGKEAEVLKAIRNEIESHITRLEAKPNGKPVRESGRHEQDQG